MFLPFTLFSVSLRTMLKPLYHETRKKERFKENQERRYVGLGGRILQPRQEAGV